MRVLLLLSFLFLICACKKGRGISLDLKHLIKTSYQQPKDDCKKLGAVSGITFSDMGFAQSYQQALDSILKETHAKGGNFLFIKRASSDGKNLAGISYACN